MKCLLLEEVDERRVGVRVKRKVKPGSCICFLRLL